MSTTSSKRRLTSGISVIAIAASLGISTPAHAQSDSGTLQGHVDGAAAGTRVVATDTNTGQQTSATVNTSGNYIIPGLRPSSYSVHIDGKPDQTATLPIGQTVTVDFVNAEAGRSIVVTGRRSRVEVRTATVATSISQVQIENLPQNDRNFLNFANLAPGVQVTGGAGNKQFQAGAITAENVNVFIDGISYKSLSALGGIAGQAFSPGNPFPQSAIQEFNVETQNFKAEFDQSSSAILTTVTKTGGNQFHGSAFIEAQPKSFISQPFYDRAGNNPNNPAGVKKGDYKRYQYGGTFGGPIIPGKLHFFLAYEGTSQNRAANTVILPTGITLKTSPGLTVAQPSATNLGSFGGTFADPFRQSLYFGKLTYFATDRDTIDGSVFLRRETNFTDYGSNRVRTQARNVGNKEGNYLLKWVHRSDNFINELWGNYQKINTQTPDTTTGPSIHLFFQNDPTVSATLPAGATTPDLFLGAQEFTQTSAQKVSFIQDHVTLPHVEWAGEHTIKFGAKVAFAKLSRVEQDHTNGELFFPYDQTGQIANAPTNATVATVPFRGIDIKDTQIGLFIQDDWKLNDHVTINAGLRWDYETNPFNNKYVTPSAIVTALAAYAPWKAAGINYLDYVSTGHNRKPFKGEFQPRLGISYDVKGDRDLVFFAGAGRYYSRNAFLLGALEKIKNDFGGSINIRPGQVCGPTFTVPSGTLPTDINTLISYAQQCRAAGTGGEVWLLNNKTPVPYTDQFDLGVAKRFGPVQLTVTYAHQYSKNIFAYVRGNRLNDGSYPVAVSGPYAGQPVIIDNFANLAGFNTPGSLAYNTILAGFSGKLDIGSSDARAVYNAIYIKVDKPYTEESGWGGGLTATIQRAKTTAIGSIYDVETYEGPNQTSAGYKHTSGVAPYRIVGNLLVRGPWDTKLSVIATYAAPPYFGYASFVPTSPAGGCCVLNVNGDNIAKGTFGFKKVDIGVSKTVRLFGKHELTARADVFNVFDSVNRAYSQWGQGSQYPADGPYRQYETTDVPRQFQVGLKYEF